MAITSSAKKAIRSGEKKRVYNLRLKKQIDTITKAFETKVKAKDVAGAKAMLPSIYQAYDKAAGKNYLKDNTASRKKSRLSAVVKKLETK